MKILGIIPARFASSRFPGKPLVHINGKTMIQRVYEQCLKADSLTDVIVATDDTRILNDVIRFGGNAMMTSSEHLNGTSRCAEALKNYIEGNSSSIDFVINIQGDEPFIQPEQINELSLLFSDTSATIFTQAKKNTNLELLSNPNIVKAILDDSNFAIDFKRIITTNEIQQAFFLKHIGIYGFKADILSDIIKLSPTQNELEHQLEQLRWLDYHYKIKVGITEYESISIDTKEDLENLKFL